MGAAPTCATTGMLDTDLQEMTREQLESEIVKLRSGIRRHRDSSGHDLCWYVPELWDLLPEKISPKPHVPEREEFLACCRAYRESLDE